MSNLVTIIQARNGSTRFPKKVMQVVLGKPILELQIERVRLAKLAGTIILATTESPEDDEIAWLGESLTCVVYRGHPTNLLERHYHAALPYKPAAVVKIPSDCPLIDPAVIDRVIGEFWSSACDYCSNLHPATYPDGNDVEVIAFSALEKTFQSASKDFELEHTTPYIWERPEEFRLKNVEWESGLNYSMSHRFTLDYLEDLDFIRTIYAALYPKNPAFTLNDILTFLAANSQVFQLNQKFAGVNWYRHHLKDLKTVSPSETRGELHDDANF